MCLSFCGLHFIKRILAKSRNEQKLLSGKGTLKLSIKISLLKYFGDLNFETVLNFSDQLYNFFLLKFLYSSRASHNVND